MAGACAAFLPYNLARPSRIFLGDGGSMPLGLLVAGVIMAEPTGDLGWAALPAYALLVALPILDTTLVVFSRWRRGVAVLSGGRDHITHRLLPRLGSARRVALALGFVQLGLCAVAIGLAETNQTTVVIATFVYLAAGAVAVARFEGPQTEIAGVRISIERGVTGCSSARRVPPEQDPRTAGHRSPQSGRARSPGQPA